MPYQRRRRRRRQRVALALLLLGLGLFAALWRWPQLALQGEFARQRWLAGAEVRSLQVDQHRWVYLEAGQGPPLLLIHGFTGSKENWLPMIGALARDYRVIAPDLPGWGESDRLAGEVYGFADQVDRLQRFIEVALPGEPVQLVGHSMGGGIAALWAGRRPPALQRLVLMDAAGVPFDNAFARAVQAGEHPFEVTDETSLWRQLDLVFAQPPFLPWPADQALIAQRRRQVGFERDVLQAVAGSEALAFAPGEAARAIQVPTLLLWCKHDRVIDVSAAAVYAERIDGSQTVLLEGCNHMPMMEQPAATADALLAHFGRR